MPYLAQREDLPDSHKLWADPGSQLERTLRALGYVDVPAPGAGVSEEPTVHVLEGPNGEQYVTGVDDPAGVLPDATPDVKVFRPKRGAS